MTYEELLEMGFKPLSHFTVVEHCNYQFSRRRYLSAMCIGTPNESIWLGAKDETGKITDLICIHNCDYDGYITSERLQSIIDWFNI